MDLLIRCGNKNADFAEGWKQFADNKKGAVGEVKCESHADGSFLTLRVLCIMNSYVRGKQQIAGIISKC
jgi:hypothetical protein